MDRNFTVAKRFDYLHMRSLLYQADILAELEERLTSLDDAEDVQTYLSSRRADANQERQELLRQLPESLRCYG